MTAMGDPVLQRKRKPLSWVLNNMWLVLKACQMKRSSEREHGDLNRLA